MSLLARNGRLPPWVGMLPLQNCDLNFPIIDTAQLDRVFAGGLVGGAALKGWKVDFKLSPDVDNGYYTLIGDSELLADYTIVKSPCNSMNCSRACTNFYPSKTLTSPFGVNLTSSASFLQTSTFDYIHIPGDEFPFQTCSSISLQVGFWRDRNNAVRLYFYCVCTSFAWGYYSHLPLTQAIIYAPSGADDDVYPALPIAQYEFPAGSGDAFYDLQTITAIPTTAGPTILGADTLMGGYQINNGYGGSDETEIYNPIITITEIT